MEKSKISQIKGRMVFDSRGCPTVEAEVVLQNKIKARAIAPSGASKGKNEVLEKRDEGKKFLGQSVFNNVKIINSIISDALIGININEQKKVDKALIELDGTGNKSILGGNTTIAVSMAILKAAAKNQKVDLWKYLSANQECYLPIPEVQIIGGGAHAKESISVQDFLIIPNGTTNFLEGIEWVHKVYQKAGELLLKKNCLRGVADEGGYWPNFKTNEAVLNFISECIVKSGFKEKKEVSISLDIAANNFLTKDGFYELGEDKIKGNELLNILLKWINDYPIISLEDPFAEEHINLFNKLKVKAPSYLQIVGDDLVTTNTKLIKKAHAVDAINTVLIKPNQIGTITETEEALKCSQKLGLMSIMSARSGETEDTTISDLSVGWGIKQLKVGSFSRSERMCKWNQCIRIGEKINNNYQMKENQNLNWSNL